MNLWVYLNEVLVGSLSEELGRISFQYFDEYLSMPGALPLSLSFPLQNQSFEDPIARSFFSGLLPESNIRQDMARSVGVSEGNVFALLSHFGGECAGAISFWDKKDIFFNNTEYIPLPIKELMDWVRIIPQRPLLLGDKTIRLLLAGAQHKLAVFIKEDQFFLPRGTSPSSHILKPPIRNFSGSVENEFFCMQLASSVGLPVPKTRIFKESTPLLCIDRYDRITQDGKLGRLHQEDFCQALKIAPENKYEAEGGPTLKKCFNLVADFCSNPLNDRMNLLYWVVFNHLIGNADAHGKNLSWLVLPSGFQLAPFYDLLSTEIYPDLFSKYAMKIGGENRGDWITKRHWEQFAKEIGMNPRLCFNQIREFADHVEKSMTESQEISVHSQISKLIRKRCKAL